MKTARDIATEILNRQPSITTKMPVQIHQQVQQYVQEQYTDALSKVRARQGLGLEVAEKDQQQMTDLAPYLSDVSQVLASIVAISEGKPSEQVPYGAITPNPGEQPDPSKMTFSEYQAWRKTHDLVKPSQGLLS